MAEIDNNAGKPPLEAWKKAESLVRVARGCFQQDGSISNGTGPNDVGILVDEAISKIVPFDDMPAKIYDVAGTLQLVSAVLRSEIEAKISSTVVNSPIQSALELAADGLLEAIDEREAQEAGRG